MKRIYKRLGLPPPKYVYITEGGGKKRYHHHLTISGGIDRDDLEQAWGAGYANSRRLQFAANGVEGLAYYVTKQFRDDDSEDGRPMKKHWVGSKNLIHPVPKDRDGVISRKKVQELAGVDAGNRAAFERFYPGYFYAEQETVWNDVNGGIYLSVKLYRNQRKGVKKRE